QFMLSMYHEDEYLLLKSYENDECKWSFTPPILSLSYLPLLSQSATTQSYHLKEPYGYMTPAHGGVTLPALLSFDNFKEAIKHESAVTMPYTDKSYVTMGYSSYLPSMDISAHPMPYDHLPHITPISYSHNYLGNSSDLKSYDYPIIPLLKP
ncbi:hypothetical protein B0T25DRAFT_435240, partial [Lasiosphaeria hispida]